MYGRNYNSSAYRYTYQGQEKEPQTGWNTFQLRMYDGRIGRWNTTDPKGQYFSRYLAMGNNPVSMIDPDGGWGFVNETLIWEAATIASDPTTVGYEAESDAAIAYRKAAMASIADMERQMRFFMESMEGWYDGDVISMNREIVNRTSTIYYRMISTFDETLAQLSKGKGTLIAGYEEWTFRTVGDFSITDGSIYYETHTVENAIYTPLNALSETFRTGLLPSTNTTWLEDAWNSPIARAIIPDAVSLSISGDFYHGGGGGAGYELVLMLRGPDAGDLVGLRNAQIGVGYSEDIVLGRGSYRFQGPVDQFDVDDFYTDFYKDGNYGYFANASVGVPIKGVPVDIGFTGTTSVTSTGHKLNAFHREAGFGSIGPAVSIGVFNSYKQFQFDFSDFSFK